MTESESLSLKTARLGIVRAHHQIWDEYDDIPSVDEVFIPLDEISKQVDIGNDLVLGYGEVDFDTMKIKLASSKEKRSPIVYIEEALHWNHVNIKENGFRESRRNSRGFLRDRGTRGDEGETFYGYSLSLDALDVPRHQDNIRLIDTWSEFVARYGTLEMLSSMEGFNDLYMAEVEKEENLNNVEDIQVANAHHVIGYELARRYHLSGWKGRKDFRELMKLNPTELLDHVRQFEDNLSDQKQIVPYTAFD